MARSKTSADWLKEHVDDIYVQKAQQDGYRTRASYKLIELDEKDQLIKPGMTIIDLGSAPGGWSQVVGRKLNGKGVVIASDILPMDPIADVEFIQGDFTEEAVFNELMAIVDGRPVDLVISDMAPNMSGVASIDQPGSMYLVELALDMARQVLRPNGQFVAKVFQGDGFDEYVKDVRQSFTKVLIRKPKASRPRSREVYVVGKGFRA
ncbi:MAG: 23S rRNA (uridine(2552)-2'-O)-methyltransferase RlmE [Saccharospirillaceae bacterium]|jgi:23S rRNA (uridine2552-2'-O)-methyltransferase|uniref:Ribosomal RNA large subunit methyltransferase E n=1 Tax=Thalassolituus hydrocarboniclasticus TaxID=2742796 RepID=A0ABY6ABI9_9GAMM|nr:MULTISPECIES: 23S rRNA (uridine(2552)-2'-O)-methyltransferase RlmE [Thalassolituus]MAY13864.1 23S rRNA (uridine(2552)-2'-O)-methyltransferase RlmE [Oceanospirillaceae bacterium]MBU2039057.1 23S rRNA (uridine(2552)-2'-O)-methyltransferase RlmE [Gammaproteobacteria bacterium]MCD8520738.1 23S rRNA (uridine(2552)-2'-O)-methyltransferase RlmE [Saccharospirillaceae bacterium]PIQ41875.1 MAG: 23S rRNA (uridine(2552)-2'-O)-methyltransferase RlmE [Thalassolituus sp. CG17_big_fil_post_rev_8_21_14_2_50_